MYKIVSRLLIYGDMAKDSILMELADIVRKMDDGSQTREELVTRVFTQMKHLLQVATDYGFDKNLWHNYLTFLLITSENPFSITCEKVGANEGSVNYFAKGILRRLRRCLIMISVRWRNIWVWTASAGSLITAPSARRS